MIFLKFSSVICSQSFNKQMLLTKISKPNRHQKVWSLCSYALSCMGNLTREPNSFYPEMTKLCKWRPKSDNQLNEATDCCGSDGNGGNWFWQSDDIITLNTEFPTCVSIVIFHSHEYLIYCSHGLLSGLQRLVQGLFSNSNDILKAMQQLSMSSAYFHSDICTLAPSMLSFCSFCFH